MWPTPDGVEVEAGQRFGGPHGPVDDGVGIVDGPGGGGVPKEGGYQAQPVPVRLAAQLVQVEAMPVNVCRSLLGGKKEGNEGKSQEVKAYLFEFRSTIVGLFRLFRSSRTRIPFLPPHPFHLTASLIVLSPALAVACASRYVGPGNVAEGEAEAEPELLEPVADQLDDGGAQPGRRRVRAPTRHPQPQPRDALGLPRPGPALHDL